MAIPELDWRRRHTRPVPEYLRTLEHQHPSLRDGDRESYPWKLHVETRTWLGGWKHYAIAFTLDSAWADLCEARAKGKAVRLVDRGVRSIPEAEAAIREARANGISMHLDEAFDSVFVLYVERS